MLKEFRFIYYDNKELIESVFASRKMLERAYSAVSENPFVSHSLFRRESYSLDNPSEWTDSVDSDFEPQVLYPKNSFSVKDVYSVTNNSPVSLQSEPIVIGECKRLRIHKFLVTFVVYAGATYLDDSEDSKRIVKKVRAFDYLMKTYGKEIYWLNFRGERGVIFPRPMPAFGFDKRVNVQTYDLYNLESSGNADYLERTAISYRAINRADFSRFFRRDFRGFDVFNVELSVDRSRIEEIKETPPSWLSVDEWKEIIDNIPYFGFRADFASSESDSYYVAWFGVIPVCYLLGEV